MLAGKRNTGIDILKIVFTFMICILHTLGRNNLLDIEYKYCDIMWLLEIICYGAVDGYAMISGYMSHVDKRPNYARYIELWFQVFFYSCILSVILCLIGFNGDMSVKTVIKSAFPVSFGVYWYFSSYAVLIVFKKYIDMVLLKLNSADLRRLFASIILLFCVSGLIEDPYKINIGYSGVWIIAMYIVGYIVRKENILGKINGIILVILFAVCVLLTWLPWVLLRKNILISYVSPTVVASSIILLVLFSRIKREGKAVNYIAALTFGIYLFQSNRVVYEATLSVIPLDNISISGQLKDALLLAISLMGMGIVADSIRMVLFKLFKIKELSEWIEKKLTGMCHRVIKG